MSPEFFPRTAPFRPHRFSILIAAALLASATLAQPTALPVGDESQVNSYTTGHQSLPAIAADADGNFVIVWESDYADDTTVQSALAQRFDSAGAAIGDEFRASFSTIGDNDDPDVAMRPDGEFAVVWNGPSFYGQFPLAQRYNPDGSTLGGLIAPSGSTADTPGPPAVAYQPDGGFIISWSSTMEAPAGQDLLARRYDSAGDAVGDAFQVNSYTTGDQDFPRIAVGAGGEFVVVYESAEFPGESYASILAQRFDSAGSPVGDELLLAAAGSGDSRQPDVDALTDGFVLTWIGPSVVGDALFARRFDSSGSPADTPVLLAGTVNTAQRPRVEAAGDQVLVTWDEQVVAGTDGDGRQVRVVAFDVADAANLRQPLQVNVVTTGDQTEPAIAAAGDDFIVAWRSQASAGSDTDLSSIQRRAVVVPLFYDGFESGTLDAWSSSSP